MKYALTESQSRLASENIGLARAYLCSHRFPLSLRPEIFSELLEAICRSAATWREGQGASFKTYSYTLFEFVRIAAWRKVKLKKNQPASFRVCGLVSKSESSQLNYDEKQMLSSLLTQIPPEQSIPINLYYAGESIYEIASQTDVTPQTIRMRIRAGIEKLRAVAGVKAGQPIMIRGRKDHTEKGVKIR
jgi:DNA-directed RNA polymerase specialized sigma24 family protein